MRYLFIFFSVFSSIIGFSQWNPNPVINTPIAIAAKGQNDAHSVTDAKGGAIIAWDDKRDTLKQSDIYAQRVNKNGIRKWTTNGLAICSHTANQTSSAIIATGSGESIIVWSDDRAGNSDIYAQKIDTSGNILWTANGIQVCTKTTKQKNPRIVSDDAGGAIIVWEDSISNYWDIYAQRISSTGAILWTSTGVAICTSSNAQINPRIEADAAGGAIITWQDKRNNLDYDIYAQRVNASGLVQWTTNGVVICNAINTQNNPRIEPDGANGALIAWSDKRNSLDNNVYAQRVSAAGIVQWAANGLLVCNASNNQSAIDIKYVGTSGLVLTWKDDRSGSNAIYAQLVSLSGVNQLINNGILISNGLQSVNPNTMSDGLGGAIISWQDSTSLGWDIKSQKLNSLGALEWTIGGVIVCSASNDQINASQVTDNNGGAVYVWEDRRNFSNYDIYATHLYADGNANLVGVNEYSESLAIQSLCYPNPINSNSIIQLNNNTSNQPWEIKIYDSLGNLIECQSLKNSESYSLSSLHYSSGIYFYFITISGNASYSKGSFISAN